MLDYGENADIAPSSKNQKNVTHKANLDGLDNASMVSMMIRGMVALVGF